MHVGQSASAPASRSRRRRARRSRTRPAPRAARATAARRTRGSRRRRASARRKLVEEQHVAAARRPPRAGGAGTARGAGRPVAMRVVDRRRLARDDQRQPRVGPQSRGRRAPRVPRRVRARAAQPSADSRSQLMPMQRDGMRAAGATAPRPARAPHAADRVRGDARPPRCAPSARAGRRCRDRPARRAVRPEVAVPQRAHAAHRARSSRRRARTPGLVSDSDSSSSSGTLVTRAIAGTPITRISASRQRVARVGHQARW